MNRDELTALRDVLDLILRLPDDLRAQVAAWLSPPAAKPGNGLDPHPPPVAAGGEAGQRPRPAPAPGRANGRTRSSTAWLPAREDPCRGGRQEKQSETVVHFRCAGELILMPLLSPTHRAADNAVKTRVCPRRARE